MENELHRDELKRKIRSIINEIAVESAVHKPPVLTCQQILQLKNVDELKVILKVFSLIKNSKMRKQEMINAIEARLTEPDFLRELLYALDEFDWDFFDHISRQPQNIIDEIMIDYYITSQMLGLIQSFYYNEQLIFVVPQEIRTVYQNLLDQGFRSEKQHRDRLHKFAKAATNLYGVIDQFEFINLYNRKNEKNKRKTNLDEMSAILLPKIHHHAGYCFWQNFLVHDRLEERDFSQIDDILTAREGKPRYNPPLEEFLQYADPDYLGESPQMQALQKKLSFLTDDEDQAADLCDEMNRLCQLEAKPQAFFDLLNEAGIQFEDEEQVNLIFQSIIEVQNHTRLWCNYGHTPFELIRSESFMTQQQQTTSHKAGRNDPCLCGSGKKYKNCCGKG